MENEARVSHSQREAVSPCVMGFVNAVVLLCWFSVSQNKNYRGDANVPRLSQWDSAQAPVHQEPFISFLTHCNGFSGS